MLEATTAWFGSVLVAATENEQFDADKVSPGVGGFVAVAAIAIALFFLGFDMVRRLRRAKFRAEIQEELAAEIAERDAALAAAEAGDAGDAVEAAAVAAEAVVEASDAVESDVVEGSDAASPSTAVSGQEDADPLAESRA